MSEEQWTREREAFLSLPRLAGRLTAELILRSPQGLDPSQDYAIDLRGEHEVDRATVVVLDHLEVASLNTTTIHTCPCA